ncbi:hypothetical protein K1719_037454 [Acacia pycnantha]|nr:hypothetical protein K1719_037454 [Acacia pycnantha]
MAINYLPFPPSSSPSSIGIHRFFTGQVVEVINLPPGSYYEATVISHIPHGFYIVEFNTLLNDEDFSFLRETVGPDDLRPLPPRQSIDDVSTTGGGFSLDQMVDVQDEEGWWLTEITGREESDPDSYLVYCYWNPVDRDVVFHSSELRVHQEWIGGHWVLL